MEFKMPLIVYENFYTKEEEAAIKKELHFLRTNNRFQTPEHTAPSKDENGVIKKKNKGIFLHRGKYHEADESAILKMRIFQNRILETVENPEHIPTLRYFYECNIFPTLVSYYENSDYYLPHHDTAVLTCCSYFFDGDKAFEGGELVLTEYDKTIEIKNNMLVIFPSCYEHAVKEVIMKQEELGKGKGRFCITQFAMIVPKNIAEACQRISRIII